MPGRGLCERERGEDGVEGNEEEWRHGETGHSGEAGGVQNVVGEGIGGRRSLRPSMVVEGETLAREGGRRKGGGLILWEGNYNCRIGKT